MDGLSSASSLGIFLGLVIGKPVGILIFCFIAVVTGICSLPGGINWKHITGAGMMAGIGFTMSIFITLLAFNDATHITNAKIAILIASLAAALLGLLWLFIVLKKRKVSREDVPLEEAEAE
jgi:NhaA family Na+:H+ antiporter